MTIDVGYIIKQLGGTTEVRNKLLKHCGQEITYKGIQKWRERNTLGRDAVTTLMNMQSIAEAEGFELRLMP